MSMNAAQEANVQSAGDSMVVGKHALPHQQAPVFDALDPGPDSPRSQFGVHILNQSTFQCQSAAPTLSTYGPAFRSECLKSGTGAG